MKEKFINLLKEVIEMEDQKVSLEDNFREIGNWDSLAHLSLIAMLDDEYKLQIEEVEFKKLITVSDLFEKIK